MLSQRSAVWDCKDSAKEVTSQNPATRVSVLCVPKHWERPWVISCLESTLLPITGKDSSSRAFSWTSSSGSSSSEKCLRRTALDGPFLLCIDKRQVSTIVCPAGCFVLLFLQGDAPSLAIWRNRAFPELSLSYLIINLAFNNHLAFY